MFCTKCGFRIKEGDAFCQGCGARCVAPEIKPIAHQPVAAVIPPDLVQPFVPVEEYTPDVPASQLPNITPKKRKKKKKVLALIAAVTALTLVLCIGGWCLLAVGRETIYVRTVQREYNSSGEFIGLHHYQYDDYGRLLKYTYDMGPAQEVWDEELMVYVSRRQEIDGTIDQVYRYEYDDQGNPVYIERSIWGKTEVITCKWEYDGDEVVQASVGYGDRNIQEAQYSFFYDRDGNLTAIRSVNANGEEKDVIRLSYDSAGQLTREIRMPVDGDMIYDLSYDEQGRVAEYAFSRGGAKFNQLMLKYALSGKLLEAESPDGSYRVQCEYDDNDNLISKEILEPGEKTTYTFSYDGERLCSGKAAFIGDEETIVHYRYDENGCLTEVRAADGSRLEYEYEKRMLTAEELERYQRQQQMLERGSTWCDWIYHDRLNPIHYIIPAPVNPILFMEPKTE